MDSLICGYMQGFALSGILWVVACYLVTFQGVRQGSVAHKKMIKGLLYASITEFYDRVPTGRILSRVSKDLRELD
jgi:ABC-type multidrug transport system fused ATPase/permease subunit